MHKTFMYYNILLNIYKNMPMLSYLFSNNNEMKNNE